MAKTFKRVIEIRTSNLVPPRTRAPHENFERDDNVSTLVHDIMDHIPSRFAPIGTEVNEAMSNGVFFYTTGSPVYLYPNLRSTARSAGRNTSHTVIDMARKAMREPDIRLEWIDDKILTEQELADLDRNMTFQDFENVGRIAGWLIGKKTYGGKTGDIQEFRRTKMVEELSKLIRDLSAQVGSDELVYVEVEFDPHQGWVKFNPNVDEHMVSKLTAPAVLEAIADALLV